MTPTLLASLRAGFVPGDALPDAVRDWIGPMCCDSPRSGVIKIAYESSRFPDGVPRDFRLPLSRPECRQRVATVMGAGVRCAGGRNCPGQYPLDAAASCPVNGDGCDGMARPPAPARHLLPVAELGDLPDALAEHSGALLACHVARVLAGLGGVRGVGEPWRQKPGIEYGWIRHVVAIQPNDREYRLGNGLCLADRKPGIKREDAEALATGFALHNADGMVLPWPNLTEAPRE